MPYIEIGLCDSVDIMGCEWYQVKMIPMRVILIVGVSIIAVVSVGTIYR